MDKSCHNCTPDDKDDFKKTRNLRNMLSESLKATYGLPYSLCAFVDLLWISRNFENNHHQKFNFLSLLKGVLMIFSNTIFDRVSKNWRREFKSSILIQEMNLIILKWLRFCLLIYLTKDGKSILLGCFYENLIISSHGYGFNFWEALCWSQWVCFFARSTEKRFSKLYPIINFPFRYGLQPKKGMAGENRPLGLDLSKEAVEWNCLFSGLVPEDTFFCSSSVSVLGTSILQRDWYRLCFRDSSYPKVKWFWRGKG